ncbi:esterase [Actinobacillus succinogenes]|uniref:Thioesterase superfamily protein n=1 Tax=Actinobacillus succinogenes (strain ATCC 55618 / DSM 22257 / CCUG 43843 / 130Z) TaxID=339671 RepID=A6VPL8_ACTSZ|nr:hotdog fold thioesterase [Actinobacillus succinogenes]ABR74915.1 thioesterase superfamily protein [Actinobacillus succinogenes 130Z]PHI40674.1 esterase [Actinobacillus succinogenes]
MRIWKKLFTLEQLNRLSRNCAVSHLGIRFTAFGDDWLEAAMPVDRRTTQPFGLLHGGISAALAETVGSMAGWLCADDNQTAAGIEINASHLRPVKSGEITARATPVRLGQTLQVWDIHLRDQQDKLCCVSRLTLSVVQHG